MPISVLLRRISLVSASAARASSQFKSPSVCGAFKMRRSCLLVPVAHRSGDSRRRIMAGESHTATEHDIIGKTGGEERQSQPATAKETGRGGEEGGILCINFPGYSGEESFEEISRETSPSNMTKRNPAFLRAGACA